MPQPVKVQADTVYPIGGNPIDVREPFVAASPTGTFGIGGIATFPSASIAVFAFAGGTSSFAMTSSDANPAYAFLPDGTVVAATFASPGDIWTARSAGSSATPPVNINAEAGTQNHPEVAALEGGRYAVVWMDAVTASLRCAIFANVGVMEVGLVGIANNLQSGSPQDLGMVALPDGGFAVTYDNSVTGASLVIVGPQGGANAPVAFDTSVAADRDSDVALLADGRLVMVARTATGYLGRFFDVLGQPDGASFPIIAAGDNASVAALDDGRFVVVSGRSGNIYGQVMRADGTADGAEFQVNAEFGGTQSRPHLAVLADGRFVVAWENVSDGRVHHNIWDPREAGLTGSTSGLSDRWVGTGFADHLYMGVGNDSILAAGGNDVIRGEGQNDTLLGEAGLDTLYGGDGNDSLNGGSEADDLYGERGADLIFGDAGTDRILGGDGHDDLYGEADADTIYGGLGDDVLYGGAGLDRLLGGDGADIAYGGTENDVLRGDNGDDVLEGEAGADDLYGGNGKDFLDGGDANDTLSGEADNDTLFGGDGNDRLDGGSGVNQLDGGTGDDRLIGGAVADTLTGGLGADLMTGGTGADRFVWTDFAEFQPTVPGTLERITDFDTNGDLIDLSAIDALPGGINSAFTFVGAGPISGPGQVAVRQAGGHTFVDLSLDLSVVQATLRLDGLVTVDAGDFVL